MNIITYLVSGVVSLIISISSSLITYKLQIKKHILEYDHKITSQTLNLYGNLQNKVLAYCSTPIEKYRREAQEAIGEFLPYAPENMNIICNTLLNDIKNHQYSCASDTLLRLNIEWQKSKNNLNSHRIS